MKSIAKELGAWLLYILIIIGISYLVITFVGQRTQVSGSSMETTLSDGDQLIVDKISYRFRDPSRYDIVVFPYDFWENMKIENSYKATIASVYKGQTSLYTDVKIPMEQPTI